MEHLPSGREPHDLAVFAHGPVVVFKWRNAPGWPVEYVSPNTSEVFGVSAEDFLSGAVAYASRVHPDDLARVGQEVSAAVDNGVVSFVHEPYRILGPEGSVRWLHDVTHLVRDEEGDVPTHFLGYVVDITQRVEAERERQILERKLQQTQRLESLGLLAGGVAHDFNNLLTGIMGHTELARALATPEQVELARRLDAVIDIAHRAADLTRQLLAYSGRGRFEVEPVDLSELVRGLLEVLDTAIPKRARLVLELAEVPLLLADRGQLQQIVLNLVTNAAEALTDEEGVITVATSCDHDKLLLSVSDSGAGMDDEVRSQLFDPFFSTRAPGRGLGLSAVHGIVRAHQGTVDVRSRPGQGSTFEVRLPLGAHVPARPPSAPQHPAAPAGGHVLVADDVAEIRGLARRALERRGYEVTVAADGAEALALFHEDPQRWRALLLDVSMPELTGPQVLDAVRAVRADLPAVLCSGYPADHVRPNGDPHTRFLQKPYTPTTLLSAIAELLSVSA